MVINCDPSQFAPAERELIERLLGETLAPGERVLLQRIPARRTVTDEERASARDRLLRMMEQNRQRAIANGVSEEEAVAAVDEAMDAIRGRRQ